MLDVVFLILIALLGGFFFFSFFRAAKFASRHKDRLTTLGDKASWWMRLFVKNGFGTDVESERKKLAMQWLISGVLFFLVAGSAQFIFAP